MSVGLSYYIGETMEILDKHKQKILVVLCLVLVIVIIVLAVLYSKNEKFANSVDKLIGPIFKRGKVTDDQDTVIKNLGVMLFVDPNCPKCRGLLGVMEKQIDNMAIYDVTNPENQEIVKKFSITDVPTILSLKNKKVITGYVDSVDKVIEGLSVDETEHQGQNQGQIDPNVFDIIMFSKSTCGFCKKAKQQLDDNKLYMVKVVDSEDPATIQIYRDLNIEKPGGVPFYVNKKNGKTVTGYNEDFGKILSELA